MIAATKAVRVHDSRKPIIDLSVGSPGFPPHTFRRFLTGPFEGLTEISPRLCQRSLTLRQHPYLLAEPANDRQAHDDKRIFNVVGATPSRVSRATRIVAGVVHGIGRPPEIQVRALKAQFPVIGQRRVETAPLQARWRSVQRINRRGGPIEQISPRWGTSKGRILIASSARDARGWRRALLSGVGNLTWIAPGNPPTTVQAPHVPSFFVLPRPGMFVPVATDPSSQRRLSIRSPIQRLWALGWR